VNHALERIAIYCKRAKVVQIMSSKLEKEASWSLRQDVKQLVLLDNGNVYALLSSGDCYLLERQNRSRLKALTLDDSSEGWHAMCTPARGIDERKVIRGSRKSMGVILMDSRGQLYYGDNRGNVQKTNMSCGCPADTEVLFFSTYFGFLCWQGAKGFEILVEFSRHDLEASGKDITGLVEKYKQTYQPEVEGTFGLICNGSDSREVLACSKSKNSDALYHMSSFQIDQGAFKSMIECLTSDRMFDTALQLIRCQVSDCSHMQNGEMHTMELSILYELARYQIYHEKDYRNGMLTLSMCYEEDTLGMLMFFDFLLPSSLQQRAREILSDRECPFLGTSGNVEEEEKENVANALLPYLWSSRSKILCQSIPRNRGSELTLLDSAIFNCLLKSASDGSLLKFLQRRDVSVDYETSRIQLQQSMMYRELLELYKSQGHHSTAMDLLKMLSTGPRDKVEFPGLNGRKGACEAAKYLSTISNPDVSLIKFHSRWMMHLDPSAVLDMFLGMHPSIPTSTAVSIMSRDGTTSSISYAARYLEEILARSDNNSIDDECKSDLIALYLNLIVSSSNTSEISKSTLCKLEDLFTSLKGTCHVNFDQMFDLLPSKSVSRSEELQARVLLLERVKRHREALEILLFDMRDPQKAEKYCKRASKVSSDKNSVYIILLDIITTHQNRNDILRKGLAILSHRQSAELDMATFLRLPGMITMETVHQYLRFSICTMKECQKRMQIEKHIAGGRLHDILIRRARREQDRLTIQAERRCCACHKRLDVSAHVHDGNSIFHYSCFSRSM